MTHYIPTQTILEIASNAMDKDQQNAMWLILNDAVKYNDENGFHKIAEGIRKYRDLFDTEEQNG